MLPLRRILALVLAVLWLPAAQHCMLEAAEVFEGSSECRSHATCCKDTTSACDTDACNLIESGNYRPATASVEVAAPLLTVCEDLIYQTMEDFLSVISVTGVMTRPSFERPRNASPIWQFVQRAAQPPRAPSLNLA